MPRITRIVLVLCLAVGGSPLLAAPGRPAQPRSAHVSVSAGVVRQIWEGLVVLWKAAGCIIDPDGARVAVTANSTAPDAPAGCIGDPNGLCATQH